jgi:hypothetical protein
MEDNIKMESSFEQSDPWILLAVAYAGKHGSVTLDRIIGTADSINHAIPTQKEIEGAINRLSHAELISIKGHTFAVTEPGNKLLIKASQTAKSIYDEWKIIEQLLKTISVPQVSNPDWELSESDFQVAYERYRRAIAE